MVAAAHLFRSRAPTDDGVRKEALALCEQANDLLATQHRLSEERTLACRRLCTILLGSRKLPDPDFLSRTDYGQEAPGQV